MAFRLSDEILPPKYGYPFKIRIPTKLGFKNPKFVTAIYVTDQAATRLLDRSRLQLVQWHLNDGSPRSFVRWGVMAKAPQPGRAKTRLCPPLHPKQAAELSAAFLRDVTENIALAARAAPIHGHVAYAPAGAEACLQAILPRAPASFLPTGRRRCHPMCRASAAVCCMRRRRCSYRDLALPVC